MKLKLKNIGKIKSANIDIEGITVTAGLNCTGKSTISHTLFAALQSLSEIPEQSVLQIFLDELDGHITNVHNTDNSQVELKTESSEIMIHFSNENKLLEVTRKNELPHKVIYIDDTFKNTKIISSLIYLTRTMSLFTNSKQTNADLKDELSLIYEKIDNVLNSDTKRKLLYNKEKDCYLNLKYSSETKEYTEFAKDKNTHEVYVSPEVYAHLKYIKSKRLYGYDIRNKNINTLELPKGK